MQLSEISNFETFDNQIVLEKTKFSKKSKQNFQTHHLLKQLTPDGNLISMMTGCSYSPEMKLQYMKNICHVAHFHIMMVLSTKNMFKEGQVIKSRGSFGTGFTYAPVSLFELYPAIGNRAENRQPSFCTEDS